MNTKPGVLAELDALIERNRLSMRGDSERALIDIRATVERLAETASVNARAVAEMVTLLNDYRGSSDFDKRLDAWFREYAFAADHGAAALAAFRGES